MPVIDELTSLRAGGGETGAPHDIVETLLQQTKQVLAGDAGTTGGFPVVETELSLEDPVHRAKLLLLTELDQIVAFPNSAPTVLAWGIRAPIDRTAFRLAERGPGATARLVTRTGVSTHQRLTS
jgi:hypothetical protein